jgi:hypothetical protein
VTDETRIPSWEHTNIEKKKHACVLVQHKQTVSRLKIAYQVKLNTSWVFTMVSHLAAEDPQKD